MFTITPTMFIIALTLAVMVLNVINFTSALMIVKKYENYLQSLKGLCIFNPNNYNALRLWFVIFSVFVSVVSFMVNAESIKSVQYIADPRVWLAVKFYFVEMAAGIMVFQYHMLLLMDKRR